MFSETIELRGHIIDSLILPKVLDEILTRGAMFNILEVNIGQRRTDQSFARVKVSAATHEALDDLMLRLRQHGAEVPKKADARLLPAPADGIFPEDFYVTTNQQTFVCIDGEEYEVRPAMMDSAIAFDSQKKEARAVKFPDVRKGMEIVVGHDGVRVAPVQRSTSRTDPFQFLNTTLSAERPKAGFIREIAREFEEVRKSRGKIILVAGASVVHTGATQYIEQLVHWGYVDLLVAGNALAVYDIESAVFGTALGIDPQHAALSDGGHENYMRAINAVRSAGGIDKAIERGTLKRGIMHACVKRRVKFLLIGSVRDEGPLPEVVTDILEGQRLLRDGIQGTNIALFLGTMLHSYAVAGLLPARVRIVVVDINPAAVGQLVDQQTFQRLGLVTDIEPFLRELVHHLSELRNRTT